MIFRLLSLSGVSLGTLTFAGRDSCLGRMSITAEVPRLTLNKVWSADTTGQIEFWGMEIRANIAVVQLHILEVAPCDCLKHMLP